MAYFQAHEICFFTEVSPKVVSDGPSNNKLVSIGLADGLMPNMRQAISRTHADPVH